MFTYALGLKGAAARPPWIRHWPLTLFSHIHFCNHM